VVGVIILAVIIGMMVRGRSSKSKR
jgi:hypothetical protein